MESVIPLARLRFHAGLIPLRLLSDFSLSAKIDWIHRAESHCRMRLPKGRSLKNRVIGGFYREAGKHPPKHGTGRNFVFSRADKSDSRAKMIEKAAFCTDAAAFFAFFAFFRQ